VSHDATSRIAGAARKLALKLVLLLACARMVAGQAPPVAGPAVDPRVRAAMARFDRGEKEAAKQELDALRSSAGGDGVLMLGIAHEFEQRQEFAAAEPFARRAFELMPDFAPAHNVFGVSLIFSDRVEESERIFRAAVARFAGTRDEGDLVFNLGMACALLNKRLEASERFDRAIALQPNNALFRFSAGENERNLKHFARAEEDFRLAMTLPPGHPDAGWKLAVTLAADGRADEAAPLFQAALKSGPPASRLGAAYEYAVFLFEHGRASEALPLLQQVVKMRPADRLAWHYLARTLRALGRKEDAAAAIKRYQALQAEADRSETEFLLSLVRTRLSDGAPPDDGKQMPKQH
jgi:tetratricopeptide (TPR) repeat protein